MKRTLLFFFGMLGMILPMPVTMVGVEHASNQEFALGLMVSGMLLQYVILAVAFWHVEKVERLKETK